MKYKIYLLCFAFFNFFLQLKGQNQEGLSQSNYLPSFTIHNNPTSVVNSKVLLDIHLYGGDFFNYNNYAYFKAEDFNFLDFVRTGNFPNSSFDNSRENYDLFSSIDLQFLSATYQYKEHGFGISYRIRNFLELRNVPSVLSGEFKLEQINGENTTPNLNNFNRWLSADDFSISSVSYNDIGLNYANAIKHFDHDLIVVGGTLKYLMGFASYSMKADRFEFIQDTSDVLTYSDIDFSAGSATGDLSGKFKDYFAGRGFGFDIGITYKKMLDNVTYYDPFSPQGKCRQYDYKWRVSASIVDFGLIKFRENAEFTQATSEGGSIEDFSTLIPADDPVDFITNDLGSDVNIRTDNSFSIWIPTALILQADYNFQNNYYFSSQYTHGFGRNSYFSIKRPHLLTLMPRYERRWFEISLPISLYNFQEVRTGLMIRVGPLSFGTDKLGTFLSITNVTGFDYYFHVDFKFFRKRGCGKSRDNRDYDVTKCRKY